MEHNGREKPGLLQWTQTHTRFVGALPWIVGAVLGINVEFFTLGKTQKHSEKCNQDKSGSDTYE